MHLTVSDHTFHYLTVANHKQYKKKAIYNLKKYKNLSMQASGHTYLPT